MRLMLTAMVRISSVSQNSNFSSSDAHALQREDGDWAIDYQSLFFSCNHRYSRPNSGARGRKVSRSLAASDRHVAAEPESRR